MKKDLNKDKDDLEKAIVTPSKVADANWIMFWPTEPLNNNKCAALYSDGSGVFLFSVDNKGGFYNSDGDIMNKEFFYESVSHWTYLPDNFEFWDEK